jgi:hypothetical protein
MILDNSGSVNRSGVWDSRERAGGDGEIVIVTGLVVRRRQRRHRRRRGGGRWAMGGEATKNTK